MTREDADNVKPGIYLIVWKKGDTSRACISINANGSRRFFCSNWSSDNTVFLTACIEQIEKMFFIM